MEDQMNKAMDVLFPTTGEIEDAIKAEDRADAVAAFASSGPTSPVPGSEWEADDHGLVFDATRLAKAMTDEAHALSAQAWKLTSAIRFVRFAKDDLRRLDTTLQLQRLYLSEMGKVSTNVNVRLLVDQLASTIEPDVRPEKPGWNTGVAVYSSMDRYYTLRPVWEFIYAVRNVFKRTAA